MKILFIGLGSVGQRHIRNIKSKFKNIKFYTLKGNHSRKLFSNTKLLKGEVNSKYRINTINLGDINKNLKIDAAFICLPNYLHTKFLKKLVDRRINIFLEKPGGVNNLDLQLLKKIQKKNKNNKLKIMLGYHLRFHPLIIKLKKLVEEKAIGKILNVLVENGEHIADYRPYQKYWQIYHSKKNKGGGVILNQIHDLDYIMYIFEKYKLKKINSFHQKFSNTIIDTEDTLTSNLIADKKKEKFLITLLLNSFERPKSRSLKIIGSGGKIIADLNKNKLEIYKFNSYKNGLLKSKKIIKKTIKLKLNRNDLFKREVFYFIKAIKKNENIESKYGLSKSIKSLELTLKLKN